MMLGAAAWLVWMLVLFSIAFAATTVVAVVAGASVGIGVRWNTGEWPDWYRKAATAIAWCIAFAAMVSGMTALYWFGLR
ncbi:MAG: hypothetical protein AB7N24_17010 [Dehalococcoidia bacterium]